MITKFASAMIIDAKMASSGLMRTAHRHEFDYEPKQGFLYVRSRAISSRTNDNFDHFPAAEIKKAYRTFIGKPVFVNHHNENHRRARGVIVDAALHEDVNADGSEDTWTEVLMEVDAVNFPKLAQAIIAGEIDRTSMGTDVEYSVCSICNNKASSPVEYCSHIPRSKGMKVRRTTASGAREDVLCYEQCYGLGFFENSLLVEEPADPTAYFLGVDTRGVTAKTASRRTASHDAGQVARTSGFVDDLLDFTRGGRDPRNQCTECGTSFRWDASEEHFLCPEGHSSIPAMASKTPSRRTASVMTDHLQGDHHIRWTEINYLDPADMANRHEIEHALERSDHVHISDPIFDAEPWRDSDLFFDGYTVPRAASRTAAGAPNIPSDYVFVRFNSHRSRDNWERGNDHSGWITLVSFHGPEITAIPRALLEAQQGRGGNTMKGVTVYKRPPNLDGYMRPLNDRRARRTAAETVLAPAKVDTLRDGSCPVCGESDSYDGEKCRVCNFIRPPDEFSDPDLSKAKDNDLRQEQAAEGEPVPGVVPGAEPAAEGGPDYLKKQIPAAGAAPAGEEGGADWKQRTIPKDSTGKPGEDTAETPLWKQKTRRKSAGSTTQKEY